ncbi:hypothetical protein HHL16_18845 [Pseudoflavitalea sp. G-6-1-2]|uniref:FecR family protein n=1 Tax=Pseudoflavitalea sp. G-6-1-2 TaxID=2728841 RepID=UPI00146CA08E|nr:FecR family protein [Pseudoflavitalea sp. G-6-1-2]NML22942.1 hypothetical protein [Pseudoflavitalea sp. G-6-1-2]
MVTKEMLEKYFSGLASEMELKAVTEFLADENSDTALLQEVMEEFDGDTLHPIGFHRNRALLLEQLRAKLYPAAVPHDAATESIPFRRIALAASVLLVVGLCCFLLLRTRNDHSQTNAALLAWNIIENNSVQVQHHVLDDSSEIWLKPRSVLRYQAGIASLPQRSVQLEGECFFDVVHKDDAAFFVQAGGTETKVLGTAFNIEAYAAEPLFRVSLVRGSVQVKDSVHNNQQGLVLTANHQLQYHSKEQLWRIDTLQVQHAAQFSDAGMVFNNIPLKDALRRVADRYGYTLKLHASVMASGKNINGVYNGETLEQLLQLILFIPKYRYSIHQNLIEVYP